MKDLHDKWEVDHRVSSAYYPRANERAEIGVKSAKWLVMDNLPAGLAGAGASPVLGPGVFQPAALVVFHRKRLRGAPATRHGHAGYTGPVAPRTPSY